jgi:hypothetical protein
MHKLDSTNVMHFGDQVWDNVCRFFTYDSDLPLIPKYTVSIAHFKRRLLPCQAHTVWHTLHQLSSPVGHQIIGHTMGIGKTTIAYAIHFVQHMINQMRQKIVEEPEKHHPTANKCVNAPRIKQEYGFDCPCHPTSPTYGVQQRLGVTVAVVPNGLRDVWRKEFDECFPAKAKAHTTILLHEAHGQGPNGGSAAQSIEERMAPSEYDCYERPNQTTAQGTPVPAASSPRGAVINGSVFVLTTGGSMESKLLAPHQKRLPYEMQRMKKVGRGVNATSVADGNKLDTYYTPVFSTICITTVFIDECHLDKAETSRVPQVLGTALARQRYSPVNLVPMSGTPLTAGPGDLSTLMRLMAVQPGWKMTWEKDSVLRNWTRNEATALQAEWKRNLQRKGQDYHQKMEVSAALIKRFLPPVEMLMIRATLDSDYKGYPPVAVPINVVDFPEVENEPDWAAKIERLAADLLAERTSENQRRRLAWVKSHRGSDVGYTALPKNPGWQVYYRSRLAASFPALLDLTDENGDALNLTEAEWINRTKANPDDGVQRWEPGTASDPYFANLNAIVGSSAKLAWISEKMDRFDDPRERDAEGKVPRQIYTSFFFVGAYILYLVSNLLPPAHLPCIPCLLFFFYSGPLMLSRRSPESRASSLTRR